jgi:Flp pilus assembly protein TadD
MAEDSAIIEFKQGVKLLKKGQSAQALEHLRNAVALHHHNPYYLSFLGVAVGRSERKWQDAVRFCEAAISSKRSEAQLYLNLAEVYVCAGRRDDAIAALDKGLIYFSSDTRMKRARADLGKRSSPIIPFLERGHFLNRSLGKIRHRVSGRRGKLAN